MSTDICDWTACCAVDAIKGGEITASAYVAGITRRIKDKEPEVQAWQHFVPASSAAQAEALDAQPNLTELPLAGAAIGVKDIIDTADMPTENGTPLDAGRQPQEDAAAVRLLRDAGAIIMGKTVTTELAFMHPSKTRNPHHPGHTPGGSSSGSAAAVAAGMVPLALGMQTNGSVIRPASFCGVFGFKPTYELFPRDGVLEEAGSLDTVGVFARSLEDIAAVTQVLARNAGGADYIGAARYSSAQVRFAFVKTPAWVFGEAEAKHALVNVVQSLGASSDILDLPASFEDVIGYHRIVMLSEMALHYARYYERGYAQLSAVMREAIETGRRFPAVDYIEAKRAQHDLYECYAELAAPYDALITLSAPGPAPYGLDTTGNPAFCTLATFLGVPALSLPLLKVNGLPAGVQLLGLRNEEERLFRAAAALLSRRKFESLHKRKHI